jgi:lysophospholipase L1-like esterase
MRDIRICYVGDSFVNGTGDPTKLGWTGRLSESSQNKNLDITHYNLGVRRETSENILKRWEAECNSRLPTVSENKVVFSFGVNDTVIENGQRRVSLQKSVENARAILFNASKKYDVIMIGMPPINDDEHNERIKKLDRKYYELCNELNIPYLSIFNKLVHDQIWKEEVSLNDGAHPRDKGYEILANFIGSWSGCVV